VSTSIARVSQLNSLAAKEIRIIVTSSETKAALKALEKPNETVLLKANEAITKALGAYYCTSHNYNNSAQFTATTLATIATNWIDSIRLINSRDVFFYAYSLNIVNTIIYSSTR
jgi:hypothetical protein